MANVYAVKSGNWSDPTVWNTGALPTSADYVFPNGFTVTIDGSYTVLGLRSTVASPIVAGGWFAPANGSVIACTDAVGIGGAGAGANNTGGTYRFALGVGESATIIGSVWGVTGVNHSQAVLMNGAGTLNITGNLTGGTGGNATVTPAIQFPGSGTLNVTGGLVANNNTLGSAAIIIAGAGTLNAVGALSASGTSPAINTSSACAINHTGTAQASASQPAIFSGSASATNILSGPLINTSGIMAFYGPKLYLKSGSPVSWTFTTQDLLTDRTLYTADSIGNQPAVGNVRYGTSYASGTLTGTCRIPVASNVRLGVPVDNTVGTATGLTAQDLWDAATSGLNTAGSIGERLKNCSTVATTGDQWAAG